MKKFNYVYFKGKDLHTEGVYFIYQLDNKEIKVDSMYPIVHQNEYVDFVSYGVLNKINHFIDLGYKFDPYLTANVEELF